MDVNAHVNVDSCQREMELSFRVDVCALSPGMKSGMGQAFANSPRFCKAPNDSVLAAEVDAWM